MIQLWRFTKFLKWSINYCYSINRYLEQQVHINGKGQGLVKRLAPVVLKMNLAASKSSPVNLLIVKWSTPKKKRKRTNNKK